MSNQEVDFKIVDIILSVGVLPKESRHQPTFHECIHELSSLPISRLSSEPSYLRECHKRVVEENYKWAYDNYSTFIQTAECTKQIFQDFENVQTMNNALIDKIPSFLESGNHFIEQCRQLMTSANMNSLTLEKHNQILEILEIPQLLEACIRNNYLDEALELIAHSRKLERRHPNIGIIANVTNEVRVAAQKLLDQLFQQLGANLQLPSCLKIVGYLRRMDCLPETILRLKFLECRDNYLMGLLRSLSSNDPFFHATKYMEVTRVNLFDIATQYRAVFNDDDIYTPSNDTLGQQHHMLFSSWLVMRIDVFITSLSTDINTIIENSLSITNSANNTQSNSQSVGSKLQSLLGQSMYFGLSLSRIGSDFRGLLMPVFYQAVMKYIEMRLLEISDSFVGCIGSYKWTVNIDDSSTVTLSRSLEEAHEQLLGQKSEEVSAPTKLMNHPLLALLTNQMLSVLEDIRLCCPKVLRKRICQSFSDTIVDLLKSLLKYYQEEGPNFTNKEQQSFVAMLTSLLCCLLPHIDLCLTMLFSSDEGPSARTMAAIDVASLSEIFSDVLPSTFFTLSHDEEEEEENDDDQVLDDEELYEDERAIEHSVREREVVDDGKGMDASVLIRGEEDLKIEGGILDQDSRIGGELVFEEEGRDGVVDERPQTQVDLVANEVEGMVTWEEDSTKDGKLMVEEERSNEVMDGPSTDEGKMVTEEEVADVRIVREIMEGGAIDDGEEESNDCMYGDERSEQVIVCDVDDNEAGLMDGDVPGGCQGRQGNARMEDDGCSIVGLSVKDGSEARELDDDEGH